MMPSATIKIPGQAGVIEANRARLAAAVQQSWIALHAPPSKPQAMPLWKQDEVKPNRRTSAGDLGKRLQTARLV
jgi:hypothetical protein